MVTMTKPVREAILKSNAPKTIAESTGRIYKFDFDGVTVYGKKFSTKLCFWVGSDTYELKGKRFYTIAGSEIRASFDENEVVNTSELIEETVTQLNYKGESEDFPSSLYCNKLVCECGNIRWIKNADMFQVKTCKPCTHRKRIAAISARRKLRRAELAAWCAQRRNEYGLPK